MSFRERTAWITAITIVVCFGIYYGAIFTDHVQSNTWGSFHLGLACILALLVLQIGLNVAFSLMNPKDARTPRDERERMIHARSHVVGYYVLMFGIAGVLFSTHIPRQDPEFAVIIDTVNLGVLVMVIAALSVAVAQIVMYRRGA
jgi:hypothetical protein